VRLDRKLLLIAPAIVLVFVVAGILYAALQLHTLASVSSTLVERQAFVAAVARGEKTLDARQATGLLQLAFEVEGKRTAAIIASRDLLIVLAAIAGACCAVMLVGIRAVPREHWPRFTRDSGATP
jgi:hypothetical protein